MNAPVIKQKPLSLRAAHKSDVRTQFAALCYRIKNDKPEILLVTTRRTGRWITPKGWPMDGMTPGACALQEAWEEAGVKGKASEQCLGVISYNKTVDDDVSELPCLALLYPVRVKSLASDFPEKGQRRRKWVSPRKAAKMVGQSDLAHILRGFDPKSLR